MKLLIVTQVMDQDHPILGFFHRWVIEFAKHCDQIHVICLQKGKCDLPANVEVHSLGKEDGRKGRLVYIYRFITLAYRLRSQYQTVFVHMNQEYVLLMGLLWLLQSKSVYMWRNHYSGSFLTHIAALLVHKVYYTSSSSYTARFKNAYQMTIGIDTDLFSFNGNSVHNAHSLLYIGRVAVSKRIDAILKAMLQLGESGYEYSLTVVGPVLESEKTYQDSLFDFAKENNLQISFKGPVAWSELPAFYITHALCINMSPPGMFDKVIGESLSCGTPVITTNADAEDAPGVTVIDTDGDLPVLLAQAISAQLNFSLEAMREYVESKHSLQQLVSTLVAQWK